MPDVTAAAAIRARPVSSEPCRAVISTFSVSVGSRPACCSSRAACPDWPTVPSTLLMLRTPTTCPMSRQPATNASHSAIARHGWVALHRPMRTVTGRRAGAAGVDTAAWSEIRMTITVPRHTTGHSGPGPHR